MKSSSAITVPPTRSGRIFTYLQEMFPPLVCVPAAVAHFAAVYFGIQALELGAPLRFTWRAACGALSTVLFFLLMRVYDELKDVETDLRLGKAGDPRYKDRAIVTGRIQVADLNALRWGVTLLLLGINLILGYPWPLLAFAVVFLLTWLSFHWFFWPAVSRNLLLAFITHNPLTLGIGGYAAAVYVHDFGPIRQPVWLGVLLVALWTSMALWEVARKIRHAPDETTYVTYSKVLGWRLAGFVPVFFALVSAACFISIGRRVVTGSVYEIATAAAACLVILGCLRFEIRPSTRSSNLRPYAELYSLVAVIGLPLTLLLCFSLVLG